MTSGRPLVCKLWFVVTKGMLSVRHLTPKICMVVNYCGRQLAQRFGWAAPAYLIKEDATTHAGLCRRSLQYDGRLDGRFGVRVGTWNFGSLSEKGGEICEELEKRMIDVCC